MSRIKLSASNVSAGQRKQKGRKLPRMRGDRSSEIEEISNSQGRTKGRGYHRFRGRTRR